jgi:transposase
MKGGKLIFLPPYSPELNPIETCFSLLKSKLKKDFYYSFRHSPADTIKAAMKLCTGNNKNCIRSLFHHSGYVKGELVKDIILHSQEEKEEILERINV